MKLTNFTLSQDNIAIEHNDKYYDLHNNFDFISFNYNVKEKSACFTWVKSLEDWVPKNSPNHLELRFTNVSLFKSKERDFAIPYSEDNCLESLGFSFNEFQEKMDNVISNVSENDCSHFNLVFMSGFAVKLSAESATLQII